MAVGSCVSVYIFPLTSQVFGRGARAPIWSVCIFGWRFRRFLRRTWNMKLHSLAEKIWTVFFDYLDYLATDLLQKTLNESQQQLKPTKWLGSQLEDARWPWSQLVQHSYEATTSINRKKTRLQLNLFGWKTTFSFRSHTDVWNVTSIRCFSCVAECGRESEISLFASHYRSIADGTCPSTCPLVLCFIQREIEPKCERFFLLTSD